MGFLDDPLQLVPPTCHVEIHLRIEDLKPQLENKLCWLVTYTSHLILFAEMSFVLPHVTRVASDKALFTKSLQTWFLPDWLLDRICFRKQARMQKMICGATRLAAMICQRLPKPFLTCDRILFPLHLVYAVLDPLGKISVVIL